MNQCSRVACQWQEDFRLKTLPDEVYDELPDLGLLAVGWNLVSNYKTLRQLLRS